SGALSAYRRPPTCRGRRRGSSDPRAPTATRAVAVRIGEDYPEGVTAGRRQGFVDGEPSNLRGPAAGKPPPPSRSRAGRQPSRGREAAKRQTKCPEPRRREVDFERRPLARRPSPGKATCRHRVP